MRALSGHRSTPLPRHPARPPRSLLVVLCAAWFLTGTAFAGEADQLWPEVGAFVTLNPRVRFFFDAPYTKEMVADEQSMEYAAYVDISLKPILRPSLLQTDWARSKYFWLRIGYDYIFNAAGGAKKEPENRAIAELRSRFELPAQVWLENRARVDFRWVGGDYSNRYRFRLDVSREFTLRGHAVVPYFNVEWFYDTRYDGWSRILFQAGPEVTVNGHFRYEVYVARQEDRLPAASTTNALGVFLKWYF